MTTINTSSLYGFEASPSQMKSDVDKIRTEQEKGNASKQSDPAYVVEISDEAREMSQAHQAEAKSGESNGSTTPSLFTKAGRTETAQRYDEVLANLRANYTKEEAAKRFDEFMRSEGYETMDMMDIGFGATLTKKMRPSDENLFSHSYLNTTIIDEKEFILASTWATYSNGDVEYHKKVSDSFDVAADATSFLNGKTIFGMLLDAEGYDAQSDELKGKVDNLLEDAVTNGSLIESNCTKEDIKKAHKAEEDRYLFGPATQEVVVTSSAKKSTEEASTNLVYADEKGDLMMSTLDELKARFRNIRETSNTAKPDASRAFQDLLKRLQS